MQEQKGIQNVLMNLSLLLSMIFCLLPVVMGYEDNIMNNN